MSFRTALAADFKREYKNIEFLWKQRPGRGADTRKVFMLLEDEGDGIAAHGPGKLGLILDETGRLPCGKGGKGTLASIIRPEPRTTATTGAVCTDARNLF